MRYLEARFVLVELAALEPVRLEMLVGWPRQPTVLMVFRSLRQLRTNSWASSSSALIVVDTGLPGKPKIQQLSIRPNARSLTPGFVKRQNYVHLTLEFAPR